MLATLGDYQARYPGPADPSQITALLAEASDLVREVSGQTITLVEDDTVTLDGTRSRYLWLPQAPIVSVASVLIDGAAPPASTWRIDDDRATLRRSRGLTWWGDEIEVTYTHGHQVVPAWIVGLVCSVVQRAVRPAAQLGVAQQTTGSQTVQYATNLAGMNLWFTTAELQRLHGLAPGVIG